MIRSPNPFFTRVSLCPGVSLCPREESEVIENRASAIVERWEYAFSFESTKFFLEVLPQQGIHDRLFYVSLIILP